MTTHSLLDAAAFLGALILFALAGIAVVVVIAGVVVAIIGATVRTIRAGRGPRDRVTIDHERAGLHAPDSIDPITEAKMRAAFTDNMPPTEAGGLSDEQRRTIRDTFGPGGHAVDLDKMKSKAVGE